MRMLLVAAPLLVLFLTGGCATVMTAKAIYPGGNEDESDTVHNVNSAWRDKDGNVTLCVTGMPTGVNFWLGSPRNYSIRYPAGAPSGQQVIHRDTVPEYRVTAADVGRGCPNQMKDMTPLPVLRIHARELADGDYSEISPEAMAGFFNNRAEAPAVYILADRVSGEYDRRGRKSFIYVREASSRGNVRAVEIATRRRKKEGHPGYILVLPLALAFDALTLPAQLIPVVIITSAMLTGAEW